MDKQCELFLDTTSVLKALLETTQSYEIEVEAALKNACINYLNTHMHLLWHKECLKEALEQELISLRYMTRATDPNNVVTENIIPSEDEKYILDILYKYVGNIYITAYIKYSNKEFVLGHIRLAELQELMYDPNNYL